ncbi:MAG: prepilin peptidase [Desulfobacteraceae bacterium]|nr:prepilin peptidase [Desulfobacteraceae bacterium]
MRMPVLLQLEIFAFIFGACIGSFLNVCIYRIPEGKSVIHPPSACPQCGYRIRFYDNIPIVSYILLRGRCRRCKVHIPVRYPLVELITGLAALAVFLKYGPTLAAGIYFLFIAVLLVITFIDIDHQIIPDILSLTGIPLFFLLGFLVPFITWKDALIGILAGGGLLYAVAFGYQLLTGRDGMGGGDIKLLAMIGAMIGWQGILFTVFVSSLSGTVIGLLLALPAGRSMKSRLPFGPFLAAGAIAYLFCGPALIRWYIWFASTTG